MNTSKSVLKLTGKATVETYRPGEKLPYETITGENIALNEGMDIIFSIMCGGAGTVYSNANARIGIGDSATAALRTQAALIGANQSYNPMDSGFPTFGTNQTVVFKSTFGGTEANHSWQEWTVDNGSVALINLNRGVQDFGVKLSGETRALTIELFLAPA